MVGLTTAPTFSLILATLGVLLMGVGVLLLKRGHWPHRVGTTAHCGGCDYILTGAQTRCPECGAPVRAGTVVRGERHRRPALAWGGAALALFGIGLLGLFIADLTGRIDWDHYKPLGWLLRDFDRPNSFAPAWAEIQRRLGNHRLSDRDQKAIAEKALQAAGTMPISGPNVLDFVGQRFLDHKLTAEQANRFFAGALKVNLAVRPVVGSQSPVPYSITGIGRGPSGWWLRMRTLEAQVDDGAVQRLGGGTGGSFGGWSTNMSVPPVKPPGKHRLRVKVEMATDATGAVSWDDNAPVARRAAQDLFGDFQVIDGQTPIATVTTPSAAVLGPLLTPRLTFNPSGTMHVELGVDADALPVDVAFEVFAIVNGRDYSVGSVNFHKGARAGYSAAGREFPADPPQTVDVLFRSSAAVARQTLDLTRIWQGEVLIPNVPVRRLAGSLPATTQSMR